MRRPVVDKTDDGQQESQGGSCRRTLSVADRACLLRDPYPRALEDWQVPPSRFYPSVLLPWTPTFRQSRAPTRFPVQLGRGCRQDGAYSPASADSRR